VDVAADADRRPDADAFPDRDVADHLGAGVNVGRIGDGGPPAAESSNHGKQENGRGGELALNALVFDRLAQAGRLAARLQARPSTVDQARGRARSARVRNSSSTIILCEASTIRRTRLAS